jgi:hypothetical protein
VTRSKPLKVVPMSRVLHVRDEAQALSLLRDLRPELSEAERRAHAWELASGYALLVLEDDFEQLDPARPYDDVDDRFDGDERIPDRSWRPDPSRDTEREEATAGNRDDTPGIPSHATGLIDATRVAYVVVDQDGVPLLVDARCRVGEEVHEQSQQGPSPDYHAQPGDSAEVELRSPRYGGLRQDAALRIPDDEPVIALEYSTAPQRVDLEMGARTWIVVPMPKATVFTIDAFWDGHEIFAADFHRYDRSAHEGVTGLGCLAQILAFVRDHADCPLLVVGHSDPGGSQGRNTEVSELRAASVMTLLAGDEDAWVGLCADWAPTDLRRVLTWAKDRLGWNTDPGGLGGAWDSTCEDALQRFRDAASAWLQSGGLGGSASLSDWALVYRIYDRLLAEALGMRPVELAELRAGIRWIEPRRLPLGEAWPRYVPTGAQDAESLRRVEVMAFAPDVDLGTLADGQAIYGDDASVVLDYVAPPRRAIVELRLVDTAGTPIESTAFRLDASGHRRFGYLGLDGMARAYDVPAGTFEVAYYEHRDIHSKVWAHRAARAIANRDAAEAVRLLRLQRGTVADVETAWSRLPESEGDFADALRGTASDERSEYLIEAALARAGYETETRFRWHEVSPQRAYNMLGAPPEPETVLSASRDPKPLYAIVSKTGSVVTEGAKVVYRLVRTNIVPGRIYSDAGSVDPILERYPPGHPYTHVGVTNPSVRWVVHSDPAGSTPSSEEHKGDTNHSLTLDWDEAGDHLVECHVRVPDDWGGGMDVFHFSQEVITVEEKVAELEGIVWQQSLGGIWQQAISSDPQYKWMQVPEAYVADATQLVQLYNRIEEAHPTTDEDKKAEFEVAIERQRKYLGGVRRLIWRDFGYERWPIFVRHIATESQVETQLAIYLSYDVSHRIRAFSTIDGPDPEQDDVLIHRFTIVDWTNPLVKSGSGIWRGVDTEPEAALRAAFDHWKSGNRYPPGVLAYQIGGYFLPGFFEDFELDGTFETTGKSFVDTIADWGDGIALVAGISGAVILTVAPVPGARVAAGLLWASVIAGVSASTIRIVDRNLDEAHEARWTENALDILSILSNIAMVPGTSVAWRQGATVVLRESVVTAEKQVLRMAFVGQIAADTAQGVLITVDSFTQLQEILADPSLHPIERTEKASMLLRDLAVAGSLLAFSLRSNAKDWDDVFGPGAGATGRKKLEELGTKGADVDLAEPPAAKGNTSDGPHTTTVDVDPPSTAPPAKLRPKLSAKSEKLLDGASDERKALAKRMLDADVPATDALLRRFGLDVLDHADAFVDVWTRARGLTIPEPMLREYHDNTGLTGVDYLAGKQKSKGAVSDEEYWSAAWSATHDSDYHSVFKPAGHSVARHGAHTTDRQLKDRIKTGIAPDGKLSPTPASTRFLSFADWLEAHDAGIVAFEKNFALKENPSKGDVRGPIVDATGKKWCSVIGVIELGRRAAAGFVGKAGTKMKVSAGKKKVQVFGDVEVVPAAALSRGKFQITLGWHESSSRWIVIQHFPVHDATTLGWRHKQLGDSL